MTKLDIAIRALAAAVFPTMFAMFAFSAHWASGQAGFLAPTVAFATTTFVLLLALIVCGLAHEDRFLTANHHYGL